MRHINVKVKMALVALQALLGLIILTMISVREMKDMNTGFSAENEETLRAVYDDSIRQ